MKTKAKAQAKVSPSSPAKASKQKPKSPPPSPKIPRASAAQGKVTQGKALQGNNGAAAAIYARLRAAHPDAHCELDHQSPFQLLVATVLSAQTTDVQVNKITPALFARYGTAHELSQADQENVENLLNRIGMFRQKAKNIVLLSKMLVETHGGEVPRSLDELVVLPGVGRKTANVVLGVAFGAPEGVVVDTHVARISTRLGFTQNDKPPEIERDLMALFPSSEWDMLSHTLIFHGRRICRAIRPACSTCPVSDLCPSAFHAEQVGRKPRRARS